VQKLLLRLCFRYGFEERGDRLLWTCAAADSKCRLNPKLFDKFDEATDGLKAAIKRVTSHVYGLEERLLLALHIVTQTPEE